MARRAVSGKFLVANRLLVADFGSWFASLMLGDRMSSIRREP